VFRAGVVLSFPDADALADLLKSMIGARSVTLLKEGLPPELLAKLNVDKS
jgi:hypothetical protein